MSNMDRHLFRQRLVKKFSMENINTGVYVVVKTKRDLKCQKQTIFLETPVFLFLLLRVLDVIVDNPYLT